MTYSQNFKGCERARNDNANEIKTNMATIYLIEGKRGSSSAGPKLQTVFGLSVLWKSQTADIQVL
jgi:hypothetical protein